MPEIVFTPERVAERLSVRPKTVRDWLKRGRIKGIKIGRLWRIRERDLDAFLSDQQDKMDDETDRDRQAWLEADMEVPLPVYEWGASGLPTGQPVQYVPGVGLVIKKGQHG